MKCYIMSPTTTTHPPPPFRGCVTSCNRIPIFLDPFTKEKSKIVLLVRDDKA